MSTQQIETFSLRQATQDDLPFLREMCLLAAYPMAPQDKVPPIEDALNDADIKPYVDGLLSRPGDFGLVAMNDHGEPVGAAWYRRYERDDRDAVVPQDELTIAVRSDARRRKVGQRLLGGLISRAAEEGIDELGLQVAKDNTRAKQLYIKLGFDPKGKNGGFEVMAKTPAATATVAYA